MDNGDGSFTLESAFGPVNYQVADGSYQPIDPTLVATETPAGRTFRNRAAAFSLSLPERLGSAGWASLESSAGNIAWRPLGGTETSRAAGLESRGVTAPGVPERLTYPTAFQGADLEYDSTRAGVKETVVLPRYSGQNVFSFELLSPRLTPTVTEGGTLEFRSRDSTTSAFVFAKPHMWDSSESTAGIPAESYDVMWQVSRRTVGWRVDLIADADWLSDPAREYPVRIDPTAIALSIGPSGATTYGDAYVSTKYPTTNFGYDYINGHSRLITGYSSVHGDNYTVLRPALSGLLADLSEGHYRVTDAQLKMYCYYRYAGAGETTVRLQSFEPTWSEPTLTFNNDFDGTIIPALRPLSATASVSKNEFVTWQIGDVVEEWVENWPNDKLLGSLELYANGGGNTEVEFEGWEHPDEHAPSISIRYTPIPEVRLESPTSDVPVSGTPKARWSYFHLYDQGDGTTLSTPQARMQMEVRKEFETTVTPSTVVTTLREGPLPVPSGGYQDGGRYLTRLRVAGEDSQGSQLAWSDWTEWQAFTYESDPTTLRSGSDAEGYRAQAPIGSGLSVDLATGDLHGSRTDFSGPGLGSALALSTVYDSDDTSDMGLGAGWRIAQPTVVTSDQVLPVGTASMDSQTPWTKTLTGSTLVTTDVTEHVSGSDASFKVAVTAGTGAASLTPSVVKRAVRVWPGSTFKGSVWVKSSGTTSATVTPKVTFVGSDDSAIVTRAGEAIKTTGTWTRISVSRDLPADAYGARLILAVSSGAGAVYLDESRINDGTIRVTDGDGTLRTLRPAGDGAYLRDPLAPSLAFARPDRARGASVTAVPATTPSGYVTGASLDETSTGIATDSQVDRVATGPTGQYLEYTLDSTRCVSDVEMYLQQRVAGVAADYTYRIATVDSSGNESAAVGQTTGKGWVEHHFSPRQAKRIRVYAIGASGTSALRVAEIRFPVLTLSDAFVSFDPVTGRLESLSDGSENLTDMSYDGTGRLGSIGDAAGRVLALDWGTDGDLDHLTYTGRDSSGATSVEEAVSYDSVGETATVTRQRAVGDPVTVAAYHHDASGRIDRVTDADGVSMRVGWASGKVTSVSSGSESSPTITELDYDDAADAVTMTTSGSGESVSSRVVYDPAHGNQVIKSVADPDGLALTSTVKLDEYGHVSTATDPEGHVDTFTVDSHANVWTSEQSGVRSSSSYFENDRVTRTVDAKGNIATFSYDAAWRPLVTSYAVSDDTEEGQLASSSTYDSWGNRVTGEVPGSSTYNLLDNGGFEDDPFSGTGGWMRVVASKKTSEWRTDFSSQDYMGARCLFLPGTFGDGYTRVESGEVAVKAGGSYSLSTWANGVGSVWVREEKADGTAIVTRRVLDVCLQGGSDWKLRRLGVKYVPSPGCARMAVILHTTADYSGYGGVWFDNVRLEYSNASGDDNRVENESFEREGAAGAPPLRWWKRTNDIATMVTVNGEGVSGNDCARIVSKDTADQSGDGYFVTGYLPVTPGEQYSTGGYIKTDRLTSSNGGGAKVGVIWYSAAKVALSEVRATGGYITGTTDWRRFSRNVTVPAGAAYARVQAKAANAAGTSWYDAMFLRPASGNASYVFDANTHTYLVEQTDALGHVSETDYDAHGRATENRYRGAETSAATTEMSTSYDELDRVSTVTVAPGTLDISASYEYTDAGRLKAVTNPLGRTTTLDYDEAGRPVSSESPSGVISRLGYDGLGRMNEVYAPRQADETATVAQRFQFDAAGRANGSALLRSDGSTAVASTTTYDKDSKVTAVSLSGESTASVAYVYDKLDRAIKETQVSPAGSLDTSTSLDVADLATKTALTGLGLSWVIDNVFAKTGQWNSTQVTGGARFDFTYSSAGSLVAAKSASSTLDCAYDASGRLVYQMTGIPGRSPGLSYTDNLQEYEMSYDGRERLASVNRVNVGSVTSNANDEFGYDGADRLSLWTRNGTQTSYSYDKSGNVISQVNGAESTTFGYDVDDRIATMTAGSAVTTFTHDAYGRMMRRSGATNETYGWDARSELATVASSEGTVTYQYDAAGLPARRQSSAPEDATDTTYFWSGGKLAASKSADGTLMRYVYGPGGMPLQLIVTKPGGGPTPYWYHLNPLGNVAAITDAAGAAMASYDYDPWGKAISTGTYQGDDEIWRANPLRYRGYFYDAELELYVLPARVYDPALRRFLSVDPDASTALSPLDMNRYAYCAGDPVNALDPSGAQWVNDHGTPPPSHPAPSPHPDHDPDLNNDGKEDSDFQERYRNSYGSATTTRQRQIEAEVDAQIAAAREARHQAERTRARNIATGRALKAASTVIGIGLMFAGVAMIGATSLTALSGVLFVYGVANLAMQAAGVVMCARARDPRQNNVNAGVGLAVGVATLGMGTGLGGIAQYADETWKVGIAIKGIGAAIDAAYTGGMVGGGQVQFQ